jgi:iron complex outermembrane receptor protein
VINYDVGSTSVEGIAVAPAFNAAGFLNYQTGVAPIPPLKGQAYLNLAGETRNVHLTLNYIDGYTDQRTSIFTAINPNLGRAVTRGQQIGEFVTLDLSYRQELGENTALTLTVNNLLDTNPPFARIGYNYDPYTANPFGRIFKVNVTQRF